MAKLTRIEKMNLAKNFGTIIFKGRKYWLAQNAYISGTNENPYYEALAYNSKNQACNVYWEIIDHEPDDESNACNWAKPVNVNIY